MEKSKPVEFQLRTLKTTDKVTMRQCDYFADLAIKTGSEVPTERQLLDYCTRDQMGYAIDLMKAGKQIKFI